MSTIDSSGSSSGHEAGMRVAITGAAGEVGRHLVAELLDSGCDVLGIDIASAPAALARRVRWIQADVGDVRRLHAVCAGVDAVVDTSRLPENGFAGAPSSAAVRFDQSSAQACLDAGVDHVVVLTSIGSDGLEFWHRFRGPRVLPVDELHPTSLRTGPTIGHRVSVLRCATVWLPGSPSTEQQLAELLAPVADEDLRLRNCRWQYVDVRDVAQACRVVIARGRSVGMCNVGATDTPGGDWRVWHQDLYRGVPLRPSFRRAEPSRPIWAIDRLVDASGFRPQHTWREYPTYVAAYADYLQRRSAPHIGNRSRATVSRSYCRSWRPPGFATSGRAT